MAATEGGSCSTTRCQREVPTCRSGLLDFVTSQKGQGAWRFGVSGNFPTRGVGVKSRGRLTRGSPCSITRCQREIPTGHPGSRPFLGPKTLGNANGFHVQSARTPSTRSRFVVHLVIRRNHRRNGGECVLHRESHRVR